MIKETTINWNIKPKDGWKVEDFPRTKNEYKGLPLNVYKEYGIEFDNDKWKNHIKCETYGNSKPFIVSIDGHTYCATVYRHGVIDDYVPCNYIYIKDIDECQKNVVKRHVVRELQDPLHNPYDLKDWNVIDAWCYYSEL